MSQCSCPGRSGVPYTLHRVRGTRPGYSPLNQL